VIARPDVNLPAGPHRTAISVDGLDCYGETLRSLTVFLEARNMLTLDDALHLLMMSVSPFPAVRVPLDEAWGLTLAENVMSDVDSPPFDKALMDGYAVQSEGVVTGSATLSVIERITAGVVPTQSVTAGTAIQIMTGAPLPRGADAVVRVEDTSDDGSLVTIAGKPISSGANIIRQATAMKRGETVLTAGQALSAARIAALAEIGQFAVPVRRRPRIAVLATGDELVPVHVTPGPGQIRNSNESMLTAQIHASNAVPVPLGIAKDSRPDLAAKIRQGLESDILVLSGGVSAGKLDLVPSELAAAGVRQVFHKVDLKPGKPIWFGEFTAEDGRTGYVFGLPGNPVSSLVCFELFVKTAIRRLMGLEPAAPVSTPARLTIGHHHRSDRPTFYPAELIWTPAGLTARPVVWHGSSDLRATVEATGMIFLPTGDRKYDAGEIVEAHWW
jgi:molybdopterin molybdotransferase